MYIMFTFTLFGMEEGLEDKVDLSWQNGLRDVELGYTYMQEDT